MVGDRDRAPGLAQALVHTDSPAATEGLLRRLQHDLPAAFPQSRVAIRGLVQGPPVDAPVELWLVGSNRDALRLAGEASRAVLADVPELAPVTAGLGGGAPRLTVDVAEARARLLGLDLAGIAGQMAAGLEGATGGALLEGTEELPDRVRLGAGLRADPVAPGDMPILPPGAAQAAAEGRWPAVPLSVLEPLRPEPVAGKITRRNGERVNTVQGFPLPGVLPSVALDAALQAITAAGWQPPPGLRLEAGDDSDARDAAVRALVAPPGLIVTLALAVVGSVALSVTLACAFTRQLFALTLRRPSPEPDLVPDLAPDPRPALPARPPAIAPPRRPLAPVRTAARSLARCRPRAGGALPARAPRRDGTGSPPPEGAGRSCRWCSRRRSRSPSRGATFPGTSSRRSTSRSVRR